MEYKGKKAIVDSLNEYEINPVVVDPIADKHEMYKTYGTYLL